MRVTPHPHNSGASPGPSALSGFGVRHARSTSQYDSVPSASPSAHPAQSARRTVLRCAPRSAQNGILPNIRARAARACNILPLLEPQARPSGASAENAGIAGLPAASPFPACSTRSRPPSCLRPSQSYLPGVVKPSISRVSETGVLVYISGQVGAAKVYQVDVVNGNVLEYANTNDSGFTNPVLVFGIGLEPDASACYLADNSAGGRLVRIPAGNTSPIMNTYGNWTFTLADPAPVDVGAYHRVYTSSQGTWGPILTVSTETITYLVLSLPYGSTQPRSIEMDRGASTPTSDRFFWAANRGMAHGYNLNPIADPGGTTPPRFLGAEVYEYETTPNFFQITAEPMWNMTMPFKEPRIAQKVSLSNSVPGQLYPTPNQLFDRVISFQVRGWNGNYVNLRLIAPPDDAPYAPRDTRGTPTGWPATNPARRPAVPPYEANDNEAWRGWDGVSPLDFGLTWDPQGQTGLTLSANMVRIFTPPATNQTGAVTYYLKVPARYAGDNFQVEVTRIDPKTGQPIPNQTPELSQVFTGWKRAFTERDHMFRRGGLLHDNAAAGNSTILLYKLPNDTRWDNLQVGDKIAIFDTASPFEGSHDEAYIGTINDMAGTPTPPAPHQVALSLVTTRGGSTAYTLTRAYTASPPATSYYPDFSLGNSAGVGVVNSNDGQITDTTPYQINASNSCFYDPDMRDIYQPFTDAFVEFIAPTDGMGAVPYISNTVSDFYVITPAQGGSEPGKTRRRQFQQLWFKNKDTTNYLHLIGSRGENYPASDVGGFTWRWSLYTFIYQETLAQVEPTFLVEYEKMVNDHEFGHQFRTNECASSGHDTRPAWCNTNLPQSCPGQPCLEDATGGGPIYSRDKINRFCKEDLLLGDPVCGDGSGAVRTTTDLVKTE